LTGFGAGFGAGLGAALAGAVEGLGVSKGHRCCLDFSFAKRAMPGVDDEHSPATERSDPALPILAVQSVLSQRRGLRARAQ
jgi:hypothetical protein